MNPAGHNFSDYFKMLRMKNLILAGRIFFGIGIAGIGIQQLFYGEFRPVWVSQWPGWIPWQGFWADLTGILLLITGVLICFRKNARTVSLFLGMGFLLFFCFFHMIYQLFISPDTLNPGSWTNPLKELAFSGGAFCIAGSYASPNGFPKTGQASFPAILIRLGPLFFSLMLVLFGIDHFLYTSFVAGLVPSWIPGHRFWTYFAGIALIGAGLFIGLKIQVRLVGILLAVMLLLWVILLHIPRAATDSSGDQGNELTSVFEALAFSGIAWIIAYTTPGTAKPVYTLSSN